MILYILHRDPYEEDDDDDSDDEDIPRKKKKVHIQYHTCMMQIRYYCLVTLISALSVETFQRY